MPNGFRHYAFTCNNYTDDDLLSIARAAESPEVNYAVYGKEVGATGTPHLQGHVYFRTQHSLAKAKKALSIEAHYTVVRRVPNSIEYCKKDGDFREFGTPPELSSNSGNRNDLQAIRDAISGGTTDLSVLRAEHASVCARFPKFVDAVIRDFKPKPRVPDYPLRTWQTELVEFCSGIPSPRKILFVVDFKGNAGKTHASDHIESIMDHVQVMSPGKYADLAYEYQESTKILILDIPRSKVKFVDHLYYFLEKVKDGRVFSPKYEPVTKRFDRPHVVVMMNEEPDPKAMSEDRYAYMRLFKSGKVFTTESIVDEKVN